MYLLKTNIAFIVAYIFIFGVLYHYCVRFNIVAFVCRCTYFVSSLCAAFCINILYPNRFNTNTHTNLLHYRTNGRERESSSRRRCWHDDEQKTNVVLEPSAAGFKERRPSMQPPLPTSLLFCASSSKYNGRSRIGNWSSRESRSESRNRSGSSSSSIHTYVLNNFPFTISLYQHQIAKGNEAKWDRRHRKICVVGASVRSLASASATGSS